MGRTLEDYQIQNRPGVKELEIEDGPHDDDYLQKISKRLYDHNVDIIAGSMIVPVTVVAMDNSFIVPITLGIVNARSICSAKNRLDFTHIVVANIIILAMRFSKLGDVRKDGLVFRIAMFCVLIAITLISKQDPLYIIPALFSI